MAEMVFLFREHETYFYDSHIVLTFLLFTN